MSSINGISNEDSTKLATAMMGLSLAKDTLQKYVGSDGMEFEIIYQSLLDYMKSNTDNQSLKDIFGAAGSSSKGTISADELKNMLNNAAAYADTTNRVSNTSSALTSSTGNASIDSTIEKYANKYGVNANLIRSVIKAESDFNPTCTSGAGAQGLMQLMPENSKYYGVTNPYDIDQNINAGTQLLKQYLNMYNGDTQMALAAYNAGPGTLQRRGVTSASDFYKLPSETRNYVPKVMGYYNSGI